MILITQLYIEIIDKNLVLMLLILLLLRYNEIKEKKGLAAGAKI